LTGARCWTTASWGWRCKAGARRPPWRACDGSCGTLGLGEFAHRFPAQLSGGMRQRAALVRTLAMDPKVLLLDEPFSALDYQTRLQLEDEVSQILRPQGRTVVLVTHDIAEAVSMADRVIVLTHRPARVKREYVIDLHPRRSPVQVRESPDFSRYFRDIWRDLDVHI